jgi:hypothetical protein
MIVVRVGVLRYGLVIGSQELLTTMLAAKVQSLAVTLGTAGLLLINRHAANRIDGHAIDSIRRAT